MKAGQLISYILEVPTVRTRCVWLSLIASDSTPSILGIMMHHMFFVVQGIAPLLINLGRFFNTNFLYFFHNFLFLFLKFNFFLFDPYFLIFIARTIFFYQIFGGRREISNFNINFNEEC